MTCGFLVRATETIRTNGRAALMPERLTGVVFIALGLNLLRARPHPGRPEPGSSDQK
jgi:hypothetical protein